MEQKTNIRDLEGKSPYEVYDDQDLLGPEGKYKEYIENLI